MDLDAHAKPPEDLRNAFKKYQKVTCKILNDDENIIDFQRGLTERQRRLFQFIDNYNSDYLLKIFADFLANMPGASAESKLSLSECEVLQLGAYSYIDIPGRPRPLSVVKLNLYAHAMIYNKILYTRILTVLGLLIIPSLLPRRVQEKILACLLHRDLANPNHCTNVNFHHNIQYPADQSSFFNHCPSSDGLFRPKDPALHRPMALQQFLNKKLRWITLGGQYDWTEKKYPEGDPPPFPNDLGQLLQSLFPETKPEAGIVNLYTPGDLLSLHRDVSEECAKGLISASFGCDGLFIVGASDHARDEESKFVIIRVRSGDVLYMTEQARYAWHGVPLIIRDSCPHWLSHWPATRESNSSDDMQAQPYQKWAGWMASKRVNLNVRQMRG